MISVGIDVSKGKSTVCILKPYGEVLCRPFDVSHNTDEMGALADMLSKFDDDIKIVMEATGIYHLPVLVYLKEKQFFVSVINPYEMKQYRMRGLRGGKTDKRDSISIANYGIDNWYHLREYQADEAVYAELKLLGRQYSHYMKLHIDSLHELTHLLDYTMPGIKKLLGSWDENSGKDKLGDFAAEFWHYDNITKFSEEEFTEKYKIWAKEKKYHQSQRKGGKAREERERHRAEEHNQEVRQGGGQRPHQSVRAQRGNPGDTGRERQRQDHADEHDLRHLPSRRGPDLRERRGSEHPLPEGCLSAGHRHDPPALQAGERADGGGEHRAGAVGAHEAGHHRRGHPHQQAGAQVWL